MHFYDPLVQNRKPNRDKLIAYGFCADREHYRYETAIGKGDFLLKIEIDATGSTVLTVWDNAFAEEYSLIHNLHATGSFVSELRAECEGILRDIVQNCFDSDLYQNDTVKRVLAEIQSRYGVKPEFPWADDNAVFREPISGKWFGIVMRISGRKLGLQTDEIIEVMNLKADPAEVQTLITLPGYHKAYHMNKKHWYTLRLDGSVKVSEIAARIDNSYTLIERRATCKK